MSIGQNSWLVSLCLAMENPALVLRRIPVTQMIELKRDFCLREGSGSGLVKCFTGRHIHGSRKLVIKLKSLLVKLSLSFLTKETATDAIVAWDKERK